MMDKPGGKKINDFYMSEIKKHDAECDFVGCDCGGQTVRVLLDHIAAVEGEVEEWKDTYERETKDLLGDCKELEDNYDNDLKKDRERYKKMCRGLERMIDECCNHEASLKERDREIEGWRVEMNIQLEAYEALKMGNRKQIKDLQSTLDQMREQPLCSFGCDICEEIMAQQSCTEGEKKVLIEKEKVMGELTASEGIFAFCAWLTTREEKTVMGSTADCSPVVELIKEFCDTNHLADPRDNYTDFFKMPD